MEPPEPTFKDDFYALLAALAGAGGVSSLTFHTVFTEPLTGIAWGHLRNDAGADIYIGPAKDGSIGPTKWHPTTSLPSGCMGCPMSQADANKVKAGSVSSGTGKISSGGSLYRGQEIKHSNGQTVLKLAA